MAIKGKKKSQSRGSQGQRRPAAAPRPVYTGRKQTPWYKTTEGRLIGGMIIAVILGVAIWAIADAQNKSKEKTATRASLEEYVTAVRAFATTIGPVAEDMSLVPAAEPDIEALKEDAAKWTGDLTNAQAQVTVLTPPDEAGVANKLFLESLNGFLAAARTFESAVKAEGNLQADLLALASQQREQAATLFDLGVEALDNELVDVDGDLSGLSIPQGNVAPPGQPPAGSTEIELPPVEGEGEGGGGGGQGGGNEEGGGDGGDGN